MKTESPGVLRRSAIGGEASQPFHRVMNTYASCLLFVASVENAVEVRNCICFLTPKGALYMMCLVFALAAGGFAMQGRC